MLRRTKTSEKLSALTSHSFARRVKQVRGKFSFKKVNNASRDAHAAARASGRVSGGVSGEVLGAAGGMVLEGRPMMTRAVENAASSADPTESYMTSTDLTALLDELVATQAKHNAEAARAVAQQSLPAAIGKALTQKDIKLDQLLREWDVNGSGEVSKQEFRASIRSPKLGLPHELIEDVTKLDDLFYRLDVNHNGLLDLVELKAALRGFQDEKNEAIAAERHSLKAEARARRHARLVQQALDATILYEQANAAAQKASMQRKAIGGGRERVNAQTSPSARGGGGGSGTPSHDVAAVGELRQAAHALQAEMRRTFEQDAIADVERQRYEAEMKAESERAREVEMKARAAAEQKAAAWAARDKAALGSKKVQSAQRARALGGAVTASARGQVSTRQQRSLLQSSRTTGGGTSSTSRQDLQRSTATRVATTAKV